MVGPPSAARLDALTGLRFVAAAMILYHHSGSFGLPLPYSALGHAVTFFFMLSGFILLHVYPRLASAAEIRGFYVARVAKLWPVHVLTLLVAAALGGGWWVAFVADLFLVQTWIPLAELPLSFNGVAWTLSVEVFFYLAFPWLVRSFERTWRWKLALALLPGVAFLAVVWATNMPPEVDTPLPRYTLVYVHPVTRLAEFILGMGCALVWRRLREARLQLFTLIEIAIVALTAGVLYWYDLDRASASVDARFGARRVPLLLAFGACLVVFALGRGAISRLLSTRVMLLLGEVSFSLYMVHMLVFGRYHEELYASPAVAPFLVASLTAIAVAYLVWLLVEVPARRWIRGGAGAKGKAAALLRDGLFRPSTALVLAGVVAVFVLHERAYAGAVVVPELATVETSLATGGQCCVDAASGGGARVVIVGWVFDTPTSPVPAEARLRLVGPRTFVAPLARLFRPDVTQALHLEDLGPAGVSVSLDTRGMPLGRYRLELEQRRGDWISCDPGAFAIIDANGVSLAR